MLTYGVLDGLAKTLATATPKELESKAKTVVCSSGLWSWFALNAHDGSSWKTSLAYSRQTGEKPLSRLSTKLKKSGIWAAGRRLTRSTSASPRVGKESSLSEVLEPTVPISSLLTAANCAGIIRREEKNGREVPPKMRQALQETMRLCSNAGEVSGTPEDRVFAPRYAPSQESIKEVIQTGPFYVARNLTWIEWERLMGFPDGWTVVEVA